jgi:hypothetical protein
MNRMIFFFVKDSRKRYRYFSAEPVKPPDIKFSRSKQAWELAKKKLMLLPHKTLRQEQAFERGFKLKGNPVRVRVAEGETEDKIRSRFSLFLKKQKTLHIIVLAAEAVVLPFTGIAAILPGPNILFYALALIIITQWLALRGLGKTIRAEHEFLPDEFLAAWERAVDAGEKDRYEDLLDAIEKEHNVHGLDRILTK